MKRLFILITGLLVLIFMIVSVILSKQTSPTSVHAQLQGTSTPDVSQPDSPERQIAVEFEALLRDPELDPEMRASIEEKLAMAQHMANTHEESAAEALPNQQDEFKAPLAQTDPTFQPGIFEGGEGIFRVSEAVIENYWQAQIEGAYIQVFAGAAGYDPDQGVIYVITTSADRLHTEMERYETPAKIGSVHIIAETDFVLSLVTRENTYILFDLAQRQFVY